MEDLKLTRRHFLIQSAKTGAALLLPISCSRGPEGPSPKSLLPATPPEPVREESFFLQIVPVFPAGWDSNYLFDARPLEMTRNGLIQNYLGKEPEPWVGTNGTATLASPIVKPLLPFRDCFSVLNGVRMSQIDGHLQNFNFLFTGNALGGAGFLPRFNEALKKPYPLDALQRGILISRQNNLAGTVPFNVNLTLKLLEAKPTEAALLDDGDALYRYVMGRMTVLAQGDSSFAQGADRMRQSMVDAPELAHRLRLLTGLKPEKESPARRRRTPGGPPPGDGSEIPFLDLAVQMFRLGVCRSAILILDRYGYAFDAHAPENARKMPQGYPVIVDKLAQVLKYLRETPFDSKRSVMDVTTFSIASEFGRTLRQEGKPIDNTGTDHNPLSNSVLIGGKGIRGGQVIGETDFRHSKEELSRFHLKTDPTRVRLLGRPFDAATMRSMTTPPESPEVEAFLNWASVMNTLFTLYGVSPDLHWKAEGASRAAPVLRGLLA